MHFLKHNNKLTTCLMVITTLAMMTIANAQIPTPPRDLDDMVFQKKMLKAIAMQLQVTLRYP